MYLSDSYGDIFKDKPIDERGVPEMLFDIAGVVDQVDSLAGLAALKGEVHSGDHQERDPGRGRHVPGEAVQVDDMQNHFHVKPNFS